MTSEPFDRQKHVYVNEEFAELVKDAVRFFNGTPVRPIPQSERFEGCGLYALYYFGNFPLYTRYVELNRLSYNFPIYVGKAVPKGWRQARVQDRPDRRAFELYRRIAEHSRNIEVGDGLDPSEFACRFTIFDGAGSDMIGTIEAALIKHFRPLWNTCVDGFGNHTPGNGRFNQAKSGWDVIHPGRDWAEKCKGVAIEKSVIADKIRRHMSELKEVE